MSFPRRFLLVLLLCGISFGCGSSGPTTSYDSEKNETVYKSDRMIVGEVSSGGLGSNANIMMRAVGDCDGLHCTPNSFELIFSVRGNSEVGFPNRALAITADGEDYSYGSKIHQGSSEALQVSRTKNLSLEVPFAELEQIATASTVEAYFGGMSINLAEVQPNLRDFISLVEDPEKTSDGTSES